ncbi:hypothetical protein CBL_07859 [Carabus blaptoides fortunei]
MSCCVPGCDKICIRHFEAEYINHNASKNQSCLKKGAISTLLLGEGELNAALDFQKLYENYKTVPSVMRFGFKIIGINARFPGSVHDAAIWMRSSLNQFLENNFRDGDRTTWLLGKRNAVQFTVIRIPLQPYFLTPIIGADPGTAEDIDFAMIVTPVPNGLVSHSGAK